MKIPDILAWEPSSWLVSPQLQPKLPPTPRKKRFHSRPYEVKPVLHSQAHNFQVFTHFYQVSKLMHEQFWSFVQVAVLKLQFRMRADTLEPHRWWFLRCFFLKMKLAWFTKRLLLFGIIYTISHIWYIYLHEWLTFMVNVGKYIPYMEHLGNYQILKHVVLLKPIV